MTTEEDGNTLDGTPPERFAPDLERRGATIIGLNCAVGPAPMLDTIERMAAVTTRRLSAQPNAGQPRDVLSPGAWEGSVFDAVGSALAPLLSGGTLAFAALWAIAAAILPLLVRGRSAKRDLVAATGWAAWLGASTQALSGALMLGAPRGLVVGALTGAVATVAARASRGRA